MLIGLVLSWGLPAVSLAVITSVEIQSYWESIKPLADEHGRVTAELQKKINEFESKYRESFDLSGSLRFQTMVATFGAKMAGEVQMPEDQISYYQLEKNPLANFQSTKELPTEVDVAVIGLGLAGASAVHELAPLAQKGLKIAAFDFGNPGEQASGKNGGNFELLPENFFGLYEGIVKEREDFLRATEPGLKPAVLKRRAKEEAETILQIGLDNGRTLIDITEKENIDADLSKEGWLRVATSAEEEKALREEVEFARKRGVDVLFLGPSEIKARFNLEPKFGGRLVPGYGNYHPRKFVVGVVQRATAKGVQVYTQTKIQNVDFKNEHVLLRTSRGLVKAKKVVFATNAFTAEILPQLNAIKPYVSQIFDLNHVESGLINPKTGASITFTTNYGDLYLNFPLATIYKNKTGNYVGMAHVGGGTDRPISDPYNPPLSEEVYREVLEHAYKLYPQLRGQPPVRINVGPMAFTADRKPVVGFLDGSNQRATIAAAFNGYGGTWAVWAGKIAAKMVSSNFRLPSKVQKMLTPSRFTKKYNQCSGQF